MDHRWVARMVLLQRNSLRRCAVLLLFLLVGLGVSPRDSLGQGRPVDLELALLVDVSASVSDEEFRLQAGGLAAAMSSDRVLEAVANHLPNGLAVVVIQWANQESQGISVDWALLRSKGDLLAYAERVRRMPRLFDSGNTALSSALVTALREMRGNGFSGLRQVIDLSGDGRNNDGFRLSRAREEVLEAGVTINGLPILNELPFLDRYFRDYVIGGPGAFYVVADDYQDFGAAMTEKLWREILAQPITRRFRPQRSQGQSAASARAMASGAGP